MTVEENYVPQTGKMSTRFRNHRAMFGYQEEVDFFKKFYNDEVKGSDLFEVKW